MPSHIITDADLAELTQSVSVGTTVASIIPPKLDGHLPLFMLIASSTGDFSINVGGSAIDVVAVNLNTSTQLALPLGAGNVITASAASARTTIIRWIYTHPQKPKKYSIETSQVSQDTTEAELEIPNGATELVLVRASGDIKYRLDDRSFDGGVITLDSSLIAEEFTYNIQVFRGLRLRLDAVSGSVTLNGYWLIGTQ